MKEKEKKVKLVKDNVVEEAYYNLQRLPSLYFIDSYLNH